MFYFIYYGKFSPTHVRITFSGVSLGTIAANVAVSASPVLWSIPDTLENGCIASPFRR